MTLTSRKLLVGGLWTVAAAHGHGEAHDFATAFQSGFRQGGRDQVRQQWVGCHDDLRAGNKLGEQQAGPYEEERSNVVELVLRERGEAGKRRAAMAVERWGDPPHSSLAFTQLGLLLICVFVQAVRCGSVTTA